MVTSSLHRPLCCALPDYGAHRHLSCGGSLARRGSSAPRLTSQEIAEVEVSRVYMHDDPDEGFDRIGRFCVAPQHECRARLLPRSCHFPGGYRHCLKRRLPDLHNGTAVKAAVQDFANFQNDKLPKQCPVFRCLWQRNGTRCLCTNESLCF